MTSEVFDGIRNFLSVKADDVTSQLTPTVLDEAFERWKRECP